jgi:hypothetical protein
VRINAFPNLAPFGIAADHRSPVFMDLRGRLLEGDQGELRLIRLLLAILLGLSQAPASTSRTPILSMSPAAF